MAIHLLTGWNSIYIKLLLVQTKMTFQESYLYQLLLQSEDWETLSLLNDRKLCLLTIRGFVATKCMFLPLWDIIGHHPNTSHVCSYLSSIH